MNDDDLNNSSIVIRTVYGDKSFLFMGDLEESMEKKYTWEKTDVLKAGHHGSKTSTTEIFLKNIKFKYAVGMNGYQNTFGFPHSVVVNRLKKIDNIKLYNTLDYGSITFSRSVFQ